MLTRAGSPTRAAGHERGGYLRPLPRVDGPKRLGVGRLLPRHHDRPAAVGGLSDLDVERDLAEELHTQALGLAAGPALAEAVRFVAAVGVHEDAHVLHDAEHRHVDLAEHVELLAAVAQAGLLMSTRPNSSS